MPHHTHVPEQLLSAPFLGRAAVSGGLLTARQLDSPVWIRILRSVYRHRDLEPTDEVRAAALRLVLPAGAVVAGRTAAWLHGAWKPRPRLPIPLEYARPVAAAGTGITGTRYRRLELRPSFGVNAWGVVDRCWGDVTEVHGVAVLSVLRTCFDLMRERALVEAVVVADAFARARLLTLPWLDAYIADRRGWPGVVQARRVPDLASDRSGSAGETRLRMIVVFGGLPEPFVNPPVWAGTPLMLVGYPDLLVWHVPVAAGLEYDGAYHDEAAQHDADNRRENRITVETGIPLLRYGAVDVLRQRSRILREVTMLCGWPRPYELDDGDFRRPPPQLQW
jgi:hypothetical protein